jgi:uncharacterized protein (TIGR02118 family)
MITYSVFYPYKDDTYFNMDYYCNNHLGIIKRCFGEKCKGIIVVKGEENDNKEPRYTCICHIFVNDKKEFTEIMEKARPELLADVKNYTNIIPTSKIFEVSMKE